MGSAEVDCMLRVNPRCEACKAKIMHVLRSTCGVYQATMDAETGQVRVTGKVKPGFLLSALGQSGKHAEILWLRVKGTSQTYSCGGAYPYETQQPYLPLDYHYCTLPQHCAAPLAAPPCYGAGFAPDTCNIM